MKTTFDAFARAGLVPPLEPPEGILRDPQEHEQPKLFSVLQRATSALPDLGEPERLLNEVFAARDRISSSFELVTQYNDLGTVPPSARQRKGFLMLDFPRHYVTAISESLIQFPWRTACFSKSCTNASMWGTYEDHHRGVALKLSTVDTNGLPSLKVRGVIGVGGSKEESKWIYGDTSYPLYPVGYSSRPLEVDFFLSITRLPMPHLQKNWYSTPDGQRTTRADEVFCNLDKWRKQFWSQSLHSCTKKLADWQHEQEYRLVINDLLGMRDEPQAALLEYDFQHLAGIVFGMRTATEAKLGIIKIVEQKCRASSRTSFDFFQARYSHSTGAMETISMTIQFK